MKIFFSRRDFFSGTAMGITGLSSGIFLRGKYFFDEKSQTEIIEKIVLSPEDFEEKKFFQKFLADEISFIHENNFWNLEPENSFRCAE